MYGGERTAESPLRARRVRVLAFDSGIETYGARGRPVAPGELLALVEWGGLGEGDAVFVLAAKDVDGMRSGDVALGDCVATTGRWRTLVLG